MPLNLMNYLNTEDNKKIEDFIKMYGCEDYIGNEIYLADWTKNNTKLFHLLGGKLILQKEIKVIKDEMVIHSEMRDLLNSHPFVDKYEEYLFDIFENSLNIIKPYY